MGKSSINGPFSMAMLNNQRVHGNYVDFAGSNPHFSGCHDLQAIRGDSLHPNPIQ